MRQLRLRPTVYRYDNCKSFITDFDIGPGDLILANRSVFRPYFSEMDIGADVVYLERYGAGEATVDMAEAIYADIRENDHKRIIGIGNGAVLDLAKLYALKKVSPVLDLFDAPPGRTVGAEKARELILVPTTCGTGGEVTNISVLETGDGRRKLALADDELYADAAVLIPQLLEGIPYRIFAASSLDALVHAAESFVSPMATRYTRLFAKEAIEIILRGYRTIARDGEMVRVALLADFLEASNYAGISYGNAGAGAVHALSGPLGGKYQLPHGEAINAFFLKVFDTYMTKRRDGVLAKLNAVIADALDCALDQVYPRLESLLDTVLERRQLREYGMTESDIDEFTEIVTTRHGFLMANTCVPLIEDDVREIYSTLY